MWVNGHVIRHHVDFELHVCFSGIFITMLFIAVSISYLNKNTCHPAHGVDYMLAIVLY